MAEADIIEQLISRPGQSQEERLPAELRPHFADVDERGPKDLLLFLRRFAEHVNYYDADIGVPAGTWAPFFDWPAGVDPAIAAERLLRRTDGRVPPHLALLVAFLHLAEVPRRAINDITRKHLDFFYREVLGFANRAAIPDRAHVLVELKKGVAFEEIKPEYTLSGGKDASGVELIYAPTGQTVVRAAQVTDLRSVFLDRTGGGRVLCAPKADSADGLGAPFTGSEPEWPAFGNATLQRAEIGFAIGAPVLRMKEGARQVTIRLEVNDAPPSLDASTLAVLVTGEKGWLGPYSPTAVSVVAGVLTVTFDIAAADDAVVDYDRKVHGYAYTAAAPIAQVLLRTDGGGSYFAVAGISVTRANVAVTVTGAATLGLESDSGSLNPKKAFLPFGPQPAVGSRLMIGCPEALSKKLDAATLEIDWQGVPELGLAQHYAEYDRHPSDASFTATVTLQDGSGQDRSLDPQPLFSTPATATRTLNLLSAASPGPAASSAPSSTASGTSPTVMEKITSPDMVALKAVGTLWARGLLEGRHLVQQWLQYTPATPQAKPGFITLTLRHDFLHADYRLETLRNALAYGRTGQGTPVVLNEPYTPTIRRIALNYSAHSDWVQLDSDQISDFSNPDLQFFHVGCFGQMREHGYQRRHLPFLPSSGTQVPLVPVYASDGELLIGLRGLAAGDSVSLLFQVAEGSADPDVDRPTITWFALCDNYWKALDPGEVTRDTTDALLRSGVLQVVIPPEATTTNAILPDGLIWLKATLQGAVAGVCDLMTVAANAVEVQFQDRSNDPGHLTSPLPSGSLAKLKAGPATVKAVTQPYPSFGGAAAESPEALTQRAAERLRHRNRAITAWDYERLVLDAFPSVHRVKCIPHARDGSWLAPGNVLLVVIPNLRNLEHARDPLRPKVDADTLQRIKAYIQERTGTHVRVDVRVKNPRYQTIQLDFAVRFRTGYEFNFYRQDVDKNLIAFLSPWAFAHDRSLSFGGRMYRSVLLDFVEEQESVDYVTDFKMYSYTDAPTGPDVSEALPQTPDAILVSAPAHAIRAVV